ncbi:MAG: 2-C-methyl-D-erythritol 2,4-cyclodiphosphate synthase [Eubacteriales bacterium]|nr:2-C-methyl-D-erythritol 2,4-cyclodiphosphate synthase [Eubacteriales bacterium]
MRIGHGYDVHRLKEGRKCIIGGVDIPHTAGLDGHSDADVLTHAIMDALLGAACLGDIGHLFPDNDDAFLGIDSLLLLRRVNEVLKENGYRLGNLDATIIAQAPKMAPHIVQMRRNLADCLETDIGNVSIKATTEERLGFTGEKRGIAAHAVCLLETIE